MQYIADSDGYLKEVSFGALITCGGTDCTEYTGNVPTGYSSLEAWYLAEADKLYRWKIVDGNLTLDTSAVAPSDEVLGEIYDTAVNKAVPKSTATDIASITVPAGTYVITSFGDWTSSYSNTYNHYLRASDTGHSKCVRGNMSSGGGTELSVVWKFDTSVTITAALYQGAASSVTGRMSINAVRIK